MTWQVNEHCARRRYTRHNGLSDGAPRRASLGEAVYKYQRVGPVADHFMSELVKWGRH